MAESATRTESVRMYVISPTGPSAPTSMPSYSCCAIRIVTAAEKPSCFAASCCSVLVRNGGCAGRRRSPFSTDVTLKGSLSASVTIARALASSLISGLWPSSLCSRAWNPWPSFSRSASMVQYSCGTNLRISSSRSQISRSATVCTRPADSPVLMLFHRSGEVVLDVHAELALRQVAHVPHGRLDRVARAQVLADRLGLGGGFDDDQRTFAPVPRPGVSRARVSRAGVSRRGHLPALANLHQLHVLYISLFSSHASTLRQNGTRAPLYHPALDCATLTTSPATTSAVLPSASNCGS